MFLDLRHRYSVLRTNTVYSVGLLFDVSLCVRSQ